MLAVIAVVLAEPNVITPVASDAKLRVPVAARPVSTEVDAVARYCELGVVASGVATNL